MKSIICLCLLLSLMACNTRQRVSYEGGGSYLQTVDSGLLQDIRVVKFENSVGVVFPAKFAEKLIGTKDSGNTSFFTPDTNLIRRVNREIDYQYCRISESATLSLFTKLANGSKPDSVRRSLSKELTNSINNISVESCLNWQKNGNYYDRQFVGLIMPNGEKVITIKLIDFRQDPHNLKQYFLNTWISGWHGWFYSNVQEFSFNINKNTLSTNSGF